ncbi:MAG: DUF5132 domain-containing protein [Microcystis sp. M04BS1]|jgi:hypothetical protein|uniref:DUF5132 domain-containing protein n=1 Tax=Microcystis aeruginosa Ma_MB_S_20031200_S102 TaxID=2486254 RepID=A0A552EQM4_MICAE|nr:DUF5132 domain-containing protein [Microcystis aeruginosa]MCA2552481.1 DUF5132 domain-containing protein [Microcystis sp. M04BS1]NCS25841.1 DUF5132 domain-containing protein [Microcystis aeruginosa BS13-02]TRU19329.1 MAG: DUF5132 domain-containing protein [Microcystis aeruginosa Ma_MB_S_20031200_S102D]TRU36779.1 MAG: DUF5132 domain-containing protein [Microcystis aeruginosa Ma_MB_S_20031200_S102]MDB9506638.1 DUF5132 domain-containing protein [Microcystis aeruginosa CS-338/01]
MEFLLGIEPIFALGVGLAALAIAPAIGALSNSETGEKVAETGRDMTKQGIKWGAEAADTVQTYLAEASESWNDLVAEAQAEIRTAKKAKATSEK